MNYFGSASVSRLLESLQRQKSSAWRLVIVDNSQDPGEAEQLNKIAELDYRVEVVFSPANVGYFGAASWWHETASFSQAMWTAVCNTDLELADEDFVSTLERTKFDHAVLAPDITALPSGRRQNPYMLSRPTMWRMGLRRAVLSSALLAHAALTFASTRSQERGESSHARMARTIYAPHGSFILFRCDYFTRGGHLRHRPFLFAEEITIAERVLALGLTVGFEPKLRVRHMEHQSTGDRNARLFRAQRDASRYAYRVIAGTESVD